MSCVKNDSLVGPIINVAPHRRTGKASGAAILSSIPPEIHSIKLSLIAEFVIDTDQRLVVFVSAWAGGGEVIEFTASIIWQRLKIQNSQTNSADAVCWNHVQLAVKRESPASRACTVGIRRRTT